MGPHYLVFLKKAQHFFFYMYKFISKKCSWNKTRQWMQDLISFSQASQFHLPFLFFCQNFHLFFQYITIFYQKQQCIRIIIPRIASLYTRFLKLPLINLWGVNMFLKQPFLVWQLQVWKHSHQIVSHRR